MLANVSYKDRDLERRMVELVGRPFGLMERLRAGGIGSPKLWITECSDEIRALFELDNNLDTCNIELCPDGLVLRFRSLLETYALVIPFRQLALFRSRDSYTLHGAGHFVRVRGGERDVEAFFRKVLERKAQHASSLQPDPFTQR